MAEGFVFSLRKLAFHELAKVCWGDYVMVWPYDDSETDNSELMEQEVSAIKVHRETAVKRISETLSFRLPSVLQGELVDAVIHLDRGYREALACTERHRYQNRVITMNPLTTGPYSAKNFIDPRGHFDELAWAKRLVADENRSVLWRFELACVYCLEESIRNFWFSEISGRSHPYEGGFRIIREKFNFFVAIWVSLLENRTRQVVEEEDEFAEGFYEGAFSQSMDHKNGYAIRFFWARCSATKREEFTREFNADFDEYGIPYYLYFASIFDNAGYVYFFYTLLSPENRRKNFTRFFIYNEEYAMCVCLLLSRFYEPVLNDILGYPPASSHRTYALMLWNVASEMAELPIVEYKTIFRALWRSLSRGQREQVLFLFFPIIEELVGVRDMDLLRMVIRSLPPAKKEGMLLRDQGGGGLAALKKFSELGDYDAMLQYLLLFFIDLDPETRVLRLRDDAIDLYRRFVNQRLFFGWITMEREQSEKRELSKVMDSLLESLHVMQNILDRVEEINTERNLWDPKRRS